MRFILEWYPNPNYNTLAGLGLHGDITARAARPRAHPDHPQPASAGRRRTQAAPVVGDREADLARRALQLDGNVLRRGVPRDVGQGFLRDAEQVRLGFVRQTAAV